MNTDMNTDMNGASKPYQVVELPGARRAVAAVLDLASWQHYIFGLIEIDVTCARRALAAYQARTGERLSFTGYLAFCLAHAIAADRSVQAYRRGRNKLVIFDDVDVGMMVEHRWGDTRAPIGHVLRRADKKTLLEIHHEIRSIQEGPPPERKQMPGWLRVLLDLPWPFSRLLLAAVSQRLQRDPVGTFVPLMGTVGITAVGMFGKRGGWGVAAPNGHSLSLIVGGIARRPAVVAGAEERPRQDAGERGEVRARWGAVVGRAAEERPRQDAGERGEVRARWGAAKGERIEVREFLSLTLAFDHRIVDGAPAARFAQQLVDLIEGGYGLDALAGGGDAPLNQRASDAVRCTPEQCAPEQCAPEQCAPGPAQAEPTWAASANGQRAAVTLVL